MSIKSGYKPKEELKPVESIKIETGTRRGTVKYIVNGKTVDNVPIKPIPQTTGVRKEDLDGEYAPKNHKHKEYLKPEEVNIHGEGQDGELLLHEETQAVQNNGTFTLEMKKDDQYERIVTLPFTGLQHLAFADQLNYYNDVYDQQDPTLLLHQAELSAQFKTDMKDDLKNDFVATTGDSTINDGSLTIENGILTIDNEDAGSNHSAVYIKGNDLYITQSDPIPDPNDPNTTHKEGGNLDCNTVRAFGLEIYNSSNVKASIDTNGNISAHTLDCTGNIDVYNIIAGDIDCDDISCNDITAGGDIAATGTVTGSNIPSSSDKRLKNVVDTISIPIEDLANAPLVQFKWNEKKQTKDTLVHGGTLAQYWQQIAPWAVGKDMNKYLTLEYGPLALAAAVECAREIVKLKERIKELEERQ